MTFLEDFPPDCYLLVVSYLELSDCVKFSLTSTSIMKEILPALNERRNRINDRFCCLTNRLEISRGIFMVSTRVCNVASVKSGHLDSNVSLLPTVPENVLELSHLLPQNHALHNDVREMSDELNDAVADELVQNVPVDFSKLHVTMKNIMRPMKLYQHIVSKVMFFSLPMEKTGTSKVSIDQYVGDVLCLTYLGHQSEVTLVQLVEAVLKRSNRLSTYTSWILLHSAILRRKRFSKLQQKRIGIQNINASISRETTLFPLELVINNRFMSSELTLVIPSLGSRDSSFRLRDTVQMYTISAHCLYAYFNAIDVDEELGSVQGAAGQIATEWICRVHEEVRRFRSVAVDPPTIRLTSSLETIF